MNIFLRILIGLALAGAGTYFVIKTRSIIEFFGTVDWAESKLGAGGTNLFYKLLGILVIIIGFIVATNLWNAFLQATLGRLFPASR